MRSCCWCRASRSPAAQTATEAVGATGFVNGDALAVEVVVVRSLRVHERGTRAERWRSEVRTKVANGMAKFRVGRGVEGDTASAPLQAKRERPRSCAPD